MRFEVKKSENGQFYFNLLARNHEIIATSELYTQKHNALKTARLIAREQVFEIRDLTKDSPQTLLLDINGNIIRDGDSIYLRDTFWEYAEVYEVKYDEETDELWYLDEKGLLERPLEEFIDLVRYEVEIVSEEEE